ncbi:hypothetical protein PsorP6_008858 [Peronosclerospora sorghi]|uniref:Uncharacterized protein n=1 Tax=Peronosclerospora sorghi TaxID=230839 RepID=A0ACC0W028_9STRA|nr:hypothetical protein PsorP6_008858 [Peronosclerospora sorghi]
MLRCGAAYAPFGTIPLSSMLVWLSESWLMSHHGVVDVLRAVRDLLQKSKHYIDKEALPRTCSPHALRASAAAALDAEEKEARHPGCNASRLF